MESVLPFLALALFRPDTNLHVEGNRLIEDGQVVRLQGVNVPSLAWSNDGENVFRSVRVALEDWKANCIRLPVCEDRWFGKADGQKDKGTAYRQSIQEVTDFVTNRKGYVILDLHWSDAGQWGKNLGQHAMPDDNSVTFWHDVARRYRGEPHILFGLYNEPHDVDWKTWRDGGQVTEKDASYHSPGMQALVDEIRKQNAKNVLVIGGLDWAYDLTGPLNGSAVNDANVVYDAHLYPWKTQWEEKVGKAADKYPVVLGEIGCEPDPKQEDPKTWVPKAFAFADAHRLSWTAWCFHPTATPRLISDWRFTPTPWWGEPVKAKLAAAGS